MLGLQLGVAVALLAGSIAALASPAPEASSASTSTSTASAAPNTAINSAPLAAPAKARPSQANTGPAWRELSASQRAALAPLESPWAQISEAQKRKWIALARNFDQMPAADRQRLHERMGEWVALSPADRARARLNFADVRQLPADEVRAKWEAYNALSEHEKRRLAQRVAPPPAGAAVAARPAPEGRITRLPQARRDEKPLPRIAASPDLVDHNTLLPTPSAQ